MKKRSKAIVCVLLVIAVISSCFFGSIETFAKTRYIELDRLYEDTVECDGDKNWYYFTPAFSGTYSFLSYNVSRKEAYLFEKIKVSGVDKRFVQLAYSSKNPDYVSRGQMNKLQFCLTYHLEAGKTYAYLAGPWMDEDPADYEITVKLVCDEYDNDTINSISLDNDVYFDKNTYGSWRTDSDGESYYFYDVSKIIQNLTITVNYKNGTTASVTGADEIDGMPVLFRNEQSTNHWYPCTDERYTANTFTVSILSVTASVEIEIRDNTASNVTLKVVDYLTGDAVAGAELSFGSQSAVTDSDGLVTISLPAGSTEITVNESFGIPRTFTVAGIAESSNYDLSTQPVGIMLGDFVDDDSINAKDYAYIVKQFPGETGALYKSAFLLSVGFQTVAYPELVLTPQ